jgi:hypothetical protein
LRQKFYAQVQRRSFHTAWTHSGNPDTQRLHRTRARRGSFSHRLDPEDISQHDRIDMQFAAVDESRKGIAGSCKCVVLE